MSKHAATSDLLYLLLPEGEHWCRSVLPGISDYIRRSTNLFLRNFDSEADLLNHLSEDDPPAGIILAGRGFDESKVPHVHLNAIPMVNISSRFETPIIPIVTHDNRAIGEMAAEHLMDKGYKRFAYIGVGDNPLSNERFAGFSECLSKNGFANARVDRQELAGNEKGFRAWLEGQGFPLGIFAAHDRCARKVCWESEHMGFRIPDDIGVIGVDNDPYQCELSRTPLSSIELRFEELGNRAAARLHDAICGRPHLPALILIPPARVVERLSTDHLAVEDDLVRQVLQKIKARHEPRLGVAQLAESLGVSKSSLEKRFKAATGKTVFTEIHRFRMDRARRLVSETNLPVDEISERIGIADTKRFGKLFKQRFGDTPTAFRRKQKPA
jgi:LacI family transcriptional regulator